MNAQVELLRALQSGVADITRHHAWLDLFLELTQSRIDALRETLRDWPVAGQAAPLPFSTLSLADELAGLCAEQPSASLAQLSAALAQALRHVSAQSATPEQRQDLLSATEELWRQLHQHAAGVQVVTPPHLLQQLQKLGSDPH